MMEFNSASPAWCNEGKYVRLKKYFCPDSKTNFNEWESLHNAM